MPVDCYVCGTQKRSGDHYWVYVVKRSRRPDPELSLRFKHGAVRARERIGKPLQIVDNNSMMCHKCYTTVNDEKDAPLPVVNQPVRRGRTRASSSELVSPRLRDAPLTETQRQLQASQQHVRDLTAQCERFERLLAVSESRLLDVVNTCDDLQHESNESKAELHTKHEKASICSNS
jgi:hypothetical protein